LKIKYKIKKWKKSKNSKLLPQTYIFLFWLTDWRCQSAIVLDCHKFLHESGIVCDRLQYWRDWMAGSNDGLRHHFYAARGWKWEERKKNPKPTLTQTIFGSLFSPETQPHPIITPLSYSISMAIRKPREPSFTFHKHTFITQHKLHSTRATP